MNDQDGKPWPLVGQINLGLYGQGRGARVRIYRGDGTKWEDFHLTHAQAEDILATLHLIRLEQRT